mgnify:CR=1 FL=1
MRKIILFISIVLSAAATNLQAQAPKASPNAQTLVILDYDKEQYTISDFLAHTPVIKQAQLVEPTGVMLETFQNPKNLNCVVHLVPKNGDAIEYKNLKMLLDKKNHDYIQQTMKNGGKIIFTDLEVTTSKGKHKAVNPYTFIILPQE